MNRKSGRCGNFFDSVCQQPLTIRFTANGVWENKKPVNIYLHMKRWTELIQIKNS